MSGDAHKREEMSEKFLHHAHGMMRWQSAPRDKSIRASMLLWNKDLESSLSLRGVRGELCIWVFNFFRQGYSTIRAASY